MLRKIQAAKLLFVTVVLVVTPVKAQISDNDVRRAIERGISHLQKQQRADGSWIGHAGYPGGVSSLCTLALLNSGVPLDSPSIQKALSSLRSLGDPQMVYSTALQTMVFCAAEPDKDRLLISRNVQWLERIQIKDGPQRGSWKYSHLRGSGDNSNSQFALLALHAAQSVGVDVQESTWELALGHWIATQELDGSWGYEKGKPPTGSMTCAGIASVVIASGRVNQGDARVVNGEVLCCGEQLDDDAVERGLRWLGDKFSANRNPNPIDSQAWLYYYLYGVERVGRLTGRRFMGRHDWFREGSEFLLGQQNSFSGYWRGDYLAEEVDLIATSFALLFLSKGRRPVVISKLKYDDRPRWDLHRGAIPNLTTRLEQLWERDLTWQTIDLRAATPNDLLASPILFMSGRESFSLSNEQKESLRQYVNQGGFLLAEASCGGEGFDTSFRALMAGLFPDSSLRLLPPDHAVWYAEGKVNSEYLRPLYGVDACCRTSVVYCPQDLSCYWELDPGSRRVDYPASVRHEIEACLQIGKNIVTYATNRELKNKLDQTSLIVNVASNQPQRGVLQIPKLLFPGGGDDAPNALPNLLSFLGDRAQLRVAVDNRLVNVDDPALYEFPLLFMHGRRAFSFTAAQRRSLASYLERGGLVFADSICGNAEFAESFRREFGEIAGGTSFQRIAVEHPLFGADYHGFDLSRVTLRDPQVRTDRDPLRARLKTISPLLEGIEIDGRIAVILSPYDLSCAMENSTSLECKGYIKQDAARIWMNVVLFALQQ